MGDAIMKIKVIAALSMTIVMSLAAFASEQRRMCVEIPVADDGHKVYVVAKQDNVTN